MIRGNVLPGNYRTRCDAGCSLLFAPDRKLARSRSLKVETKPAGKFEDVARDRAAEARDIVARGAQV